MGRTAHKAIAAASVVGALGFFALTTRAPVANVKPVVFVPAAAASLDEKGGKVTQDGVVLSVPARALAGATTVTVGETPLPGPLPAGFVAASRPVRLTKTCEGRFARPVSVTLPLLEGAPLDGTIACYWDVDRSMYRTVTITGRDAAARTITFETVHFTDFLALTPAEQTAALAPVDTGFRPEKDAFGFTNGDYDSGGTCLAMSLISTWYFETHKGTDAPHLRDVLGGFKPVAPDADLVGREMAVAEQASAVPAGSYLAPASKAAEDHARAIGPAAAGLELIAQLRATGTPQLLVLDGPSGAHAVVAYDWDGTVFHVYDPNYPDQPQKLFFDPVKGWQEWSGTNLGRPMLIAPVSFSSYAADADMQKAFDKALADKGQTDRYPTVTVESARSDGTNLVVRGKVTGGIKNPQQPVTVVQIVVGRQRFSMTILHADGSFEIDAPLDRIGEATVSERAAPVVVAGEPWGFGGVATLEPSKTPGAVGALHDR